MTEGMTFLKLDGVMKNKESIPPSGRIIYAEVCALAQKEGYCYASNKYFSSVYHLSVQSVSRLLNALKKQGFLEISYGKDERGYRKRFMRPKVDNSVTKTLYVSSQKCEVPISVNAKHNKKRNIDKISSYDSKFKPNIN